MKKIYLIISILVVVVLAIDMLTAQTGKASKVSFQNEHPDVDWTLGCAECHAEETPEIFKQWSESRHGQVNFGCYICHGDGIEEFSAKGNDDKCSGCHAEQEISFEKSKMESCFDCHNGHTLKFHN